jgi:uncharacterized membrane protein YozB (DUF420 family)
MATTYAAAAERSSGCLFYSAMGVAIALLVFAGYARSYYLSRWVELPARAPEMTALLHLHALSFTLWILFGVLQPALVASGRVEAHKRAGTAGAALALLVWLLGNVAAIEAIHGGYEGLGDPYAFYAVTFFSIQAFAVIVALGVWKRHETEAHKRLMLLSNAAILEAAVGRLPLEAVVSTAPLSFYLGADLVILAGIARDRLVRGAIHPVWIWGGGLLVLSQLFRLAIMNSQPWLMFAHLVAGLV